MPRPTTLLAALLGALALVAAACGSDAERAETDDEFIVVDEGDQIQVRSLNAISGEPSFLGIPIQRSVEAAIADYGEVRGFEVSMGRGLDDLCSAEGGQAAAQTIVADEQIVGLVGTSCSVAATAAAPLISDAGIVMIAPSNTSPSLTSDLRGTAGEDHYPGYYRTSHNDLIGGAALAQFLRDELGHTSAAVIHDGDPYTQGLGQAFADAFSDLGGEITGFSGINKEDTDMVPVLTELAAAAPDALFLPIFQPAGDHVAEQAPRVSGLEDVVMLSGGGLLNDAFLGLSQSEGMYFSGPDVRFGDNANQSTGKSATQVLDEYQAAHGEAPSSPYWGHAYDATTLLLEAIEASSAVNDAGQLVIEKAAVREFLNGLSGYSGIIGTLGCDEFGDCGSQKVTIIHHTDSGDVAAGRANVVFEYAP